MLDLLLNHIGNVQKMDCRECSILNLVMKALQSINELEILLVCLDMTKRITNARGENIYIYIMGVHNNWDPEGQ